MLKYILLCLALTYPTYSLADLIISTNFQFPSSAVDPLIERHPIPPTPNQVPLPVFGQTIIQWGTGIEGAKHRFETLTLNDVEQLKQHGVTLDMAQRWQAFYANEMQRNPSNITAIFRQKLMKKIIDLW